MNISDKDMQAMGYSNPFAGFEVVDIRLPNDEPTETARYSALLDSMNKTALRINRQLVILENTAEKYFPYDLIPYYRQRYQCIVMVIRCGALITMFALRKESTPGQVLTIELGHEKTMKGHK